MKYPIYANHKASGVEWLDSVPLHWNVRAAKHGYSIQLGKMLQPESSGSLDAETTYLKSQHVQWESVRIDDLPQMWASPSDLKKYDISDGDLLVCEGGDVGRAGIVRNPPSGTIIQNALHRVRPRALHDVRYLMYVLEHAAGQSWFEIICNRSTIAHFTSEKFGALRIPAPPIDEQQAIVHFLNTKTAQIDALVAQKRQLIDKLKEKRSALIACTVTRGLPPDAAKAAGLEPNPEMKKDLEIEWLDQLPKHWRVLPMTKYLVEMSDYRGKTPEKTDEGIFLVTARNVRMGYIDYDCSQEFVAVDEYDEIMRRGLPKVGDILFTTEAPLGNVALVDREDVALAQRIIRFRMRRSHFQSRFTLYAMLADYFQAQLKSLSTGSTAEGLKASKLSVLRLIAPPVTEQQLIADFLDAECQKMDSFIAKADATISRMSEYRQALITSAVTGKIDVRGLA